MTDSPSQIARPGAGPLRRWGPTLFLCALFALYFIRPGSSGPLKGWTDDFQAATANAAETQRTLLVAFHSQGCAPCSAMDRTVLVTPEVADALKPFVPVRINAYDHPELARRFGIPGTPTYVVVDSSGDPLARASGYHTVPEFIKFLEHALERSTRGPYSASSSPPSDP